MNVVDQRSASTSGIADTFGRPIFKVGARHPAVDSASGATPATTNARRVIRVSSMSPISAVQPEKVLSRGLRKCDILSR